MIFVDTSALLAILTTSDINHQRASLCWRTLLEESQALLTNNYVLVESVVLVQKRLGLGKVHDLQTKFLNILEIEWMDVIQHNTAIESLLQRNRRRLSLIDCSAFETMHRLGIHTVFTFDEHFREQGFTVIP